MDGKVDHAPYSLATDYERASSKQKAMKIQVTRKQFANAGLLVILCATWLAIGWIVRGWAMGPDAALVEQARRQLLTQYPGELPPNRELSYAAIRGMLDRTGDPYAALLEPPVASRFRDDFEGQSGAIGLHFEKVNDEIVIDAVYPGEPADQAGLRAGDVILAVDGVEIDADTALAEVGLLIRGPVGEAAHIVVRRGDETLEFAPVRQERPTVSARMLPGQVAYMAQYAFTTNITPQVEQTLQELLAQKPVGLIWDLRDNGGGSMDTTRDVLSYFIEDGLLFTAEIQGGRQREFVAQGGGLATDIPLVVLIDEGTYSAAETAAAAIKDRGRGVLIGSATYGKGSILTTVPLGQDCMLQMTVAKWLSPSGEWYGEHGVPPDIAVDDEENTEGDEVLDFAVDYILELTSE